MKHSDSRHLIPGDNTVPRKLKRFNERNCEVSRGRHPDELYRELHKFSTDPQDSTANGERGGEGEGEGGGWVG